MKYALINDARARSVAKDLARLAKERRVKLTLTSAQSVTARLFGYSDWNDMLASVGQGRGPEDHELNALEAMIRRSAQIEAIVGAGFGKDVADAVLDALRPTGREKESIKENPRVWPVQIGRDHHPNRLSEALGRIENKFQWDGSYHVLAEIMEKWESERFVHPLDKASYSGDWTIESLVMTYEGFRSGAGHVVEVSALVSDEPDGGTLAECWAMPDDPSGLDRYYFHFGNHRFPSPFKDIGVDGCYVSINQDGGERPDDVVFTFTTSPEIAPGFDDVIFDNDPELDFRAAMRFVEIGFSPSEDEAVGATLMAKNGSEHSDDYVEAWKPYLAKPLCAAWTALKAYRARIEPIHNALFTDLYETDFVKLSRARSDNAVVSQMRELAEYDEDLPVRFMGRTPPSPDVFLEEMAASPFPVAGSGPDRYDIDHVRSKLADALDMERAWSLYECAKEALRMTADLDPSELETKRVILKANALIMNGSHMVGEEGRALEAALAVHGSDLPEVAEYLPGAVIVLTAAGREDEARSAAARLSAMADGTPAATLSHLLVGWKFSERQESDGLIARAASLHPDVFQRLLMLEVDPWSWFFRDSKGYEDEADENDHAACMFGEPMRLSGLLEVIEVASSSPEPTMH